MPQCETRYLRGKETKMVQSYPNNVRLVVNLDTEESRLMMDILKRQQQGGRLQLYLPEEIETAHKCGDLDALENDGGIIFLPGRPYILTVLTSEMESNKEGREVIGHISRIVFDALS